MTDERQPPDDANAWAPPGAAHDTEQHEAAAVADPPDAEVVEGEPVDAEPVVEVPAPASQVTPEPTPVVPVGASSFEQPPGSALVDTASSSSSLPAPAQQRPELLAGAAFAGGLAAALILRRLGS